MADNLTLIIDISYYQTNSTKSPQYFFDPVIAKEKGVEAAFLRVSDGAFKDPAFKTFARTFADAGIPFGCYHYARPSGSQYGTYLKQADDFAEIVMDTGFTLPPALDLECTDTDYDGRMVGLSYAKAWLEHIAELFNKTPIIYTSPGFWSGLKDHNNAVWAVEYPLWIAHYYNSLKFPQYDIPDVVANAVNMPTVPDPWKKKGRTWSIWQYCATGDGEFYGGDYAKHSQNKVGLDLDVYNGSFDEMCMQFDIEHIGDPIDPPPVEVPGDTIIDYGSVLVIAEKKNDEPGWLFFRNRPELYAGCQLAVGYGDELDLLEPDVVSGDIDYWHVQTADGREGYISAGGAYTKRLYAPKG